jgi:exodeoxyribonuclease VII small subunit
MQADEAEAEPSFEAALARLGEIVQALEKGDLTLERSLALFEEGVRLSRLGAERLESAEARVEQLLGVSANGVPNLKPIALDATSTKNQKEPR